jgi:hypothetical protein
MMDTFMKIHIKPRNEINIEINKPKTKENILLNKKLL